MAALAGRPVPLFLRITNTNYVQWQGNNVRQMESDTNYNSAIKELTISDLGDGYEKCRIQVWNMFHLSFTKYMATHVLVF